MDGVCKWKKEIVYLVVEKKVVFGGTALSVGVGQIRGVFWRRDAGNAKQKIKPERKIGGRYALSKVD